MCFIVYTCFKSDWGGKYVWDKSVLISEVPFEWKKSRYMAYVLWQKQHSKWFPVECMVSRCPFNSNCVTKTRLQSSHLHKNWPISIGSLSPFFEITKNRLLISSTRSAFDHREYKNYWIAHFRTEDSTRFGQCSVRIASLFQWKMCSSPPFELLTCTVKWRFSANLKLNL